MIIGTILALIVVSTLWYYLEDGDDKPEVNEPREYKIYVHNGVAVRELTKEEYGDK